MSDLINSIVRGNLMDQEGYVPYCGHEECRAIQLKSGRWESRWPRTRFNGAQFCCPQCGWVSALPDDFIELYKWRWGIGQLEYEDAEVDVHGVYTMPFDGTAYISMKDGKTAVKVEAAREYSVWKR